jgi:hypothetical protein
MTKINQLFDEAVSAPPPSRLTAAGVLVAARARRQRMTAALASLALVAGGITVAIGLNLAGTDARHAPASTTPPGPLEWAGRGDASHLYRVTNICGENPRMAVSPPPTTGPKASEPLCSELWASADGGATWSSRGQMEADSIIIAGPQSLLRYRRPSAAPSPSAEEPAFSFELSADAGVTWTALPPNGPPLDAVPANGLVVSITPTNLWLFDPSQGRVRPLTGPFLAFGQGSSSNASGHSLWFGGIDPATGRLAVIVARAGDRSWTTRLLPNVEPVVDPSASHAAGDASPSAKTARATYILQVIPGADGRTAYVTVYDTDAPQRTSYPAISGTPYLAWLRGFHTADGGATWQEVGEGASVPGSRDAWVTADGRLVLAIEINDPAGGDARTREFVVGGPDGRFTIAAPPGLPTDLINVDGSVAYTDHAMFVSDDGWNWREAWHD